MDKSVLDISAELAEENDYGHKESACPTDQHLSQHDHSSSDLLVLKQNLENTVKIHILKAYNYNG